MIRLYRYRLQFHSSFETAGKTWSFREGLIVRYTDRQHDLASEMAPLPGFSRESASDLVPLLSDGRSKLNDLLASIGNPERLHGFFNGTAYPPSARFAISCLALHLLAGREEDASGRGACKIKSAGNQGSRGADPPGIMSDPDVGRSDATGRRSDSSDDDTDTTGGRNSTSGETDPAGRAARASDGGDDSAGGGDNSGSGERDTAGPGIDSGSPRQSSTPAKRLAVNAVVGIGPAEQTNATIAKRFDQGYRTLKIKCGPNPGLLPGLLEKAAARHRGLTFRIDANRSWPLAKALHMVEQFSGLPVEYCEEPCHFEKLSQFTELRRHSPLPLALDESIETMEVLRQVLETEAADVVILKPTLLGNILDLIETCSPDKSSSIDRVCTSTYESGVGRTAVAQLAARIGSGRLAHGLDTGRLLKEDLYSEKIADGSMPVTGYNNWCIPFSQCHREHLSRIEL